jgi:hypothetical protein
MRTLLSIAIGGLLAVAVMIFGVKPGSLPEVVNGFAGSSVASMAGSVPQIVPKSPVCPSCYLDFGLFGW